MLLRNSISSTKKFFQKTIDNVKSFLSKTPYERLPKTPPFNPFSCGRRRKMEIHIAGRYKDSQESTTNGTDYCSTRHHHHDFTDNQWSLSKGSTTKATTEAVADDQKNKRSAAATGKENYLDQKLATIEEKASDSPVKGNIDNNGRREFGRGMNNGGGGGRRRRQETCFRDTRRMNCWVTQKLKEFEMVDRSNIDYLLDIEENSVMVRNQYRLGVRSQLSSNTLAKVQSAVLH